MTVTEKVRGVIHNKVWIVNSIRNKVQTLPKSSLVIYSAILMILSLVTMIQTLALQNSFPLNILRHRSDYFLGFEIGIYITSAIPSLFYLFPIILFLFIKDWKTRYGLLLFHFIFSSLLLFIYFSVIGGLVWWITILIICFFLVSSHLFSFLIYLGCDFYHYQSRKHISLE